MSTALGLREVDDKALLDTPAEVLDVVVTQADVDGRSIAELADDDAVRSVYLRRARRVGTPVTILPGHRGSTAATSSRSSGPRAGSNTP